MALHPATLATPPRHWTSGSRATSASTRTERSASDAPAVKSSKKSIKETSNKKMNNVSQNTEYKAISGENEIRSILRNMKKYIENNCENMGENFANEARLISKGDAKERGIYGKVSNKEAEELLDEGIEINAIPWLKDDA